LKLCRADAKSISFLTVAECQTDSVEKRKGRNSRGEKHLWWLI